MGALLHVLAIPRESDGFKAFCLLFQGIRPLIVGFQIFNFS